MIENIEITRFKNLREISIPLGRLTAFVGANNAGKSSILQSLQFAISIVQSLELYSTKVPWKEGKRAGSLAFDQLVYMPFVDIEALAFERKLTQNPASSIKVALYDNANNATTVAVRRGKNKNLTVNVDGMALGKQLEPLTTPFAVFAPGLAGIPAREEFLGWGCTTGGRQGGCKCNSPKCIVLTAPGL